MDAPTDLLEGIPDILYKYRDWNNPDHKRILTHKEIYFASVDQFNDPFDGTIPFRYDPIQLTDENKFIKYRLLAKRYHPDWNETQIHNYAYEYHMKRGLMSDEHHLEKFEEDTRKEVNKTFGIFSLTKERNNILMWSHYSNSHNGFCVGFVKGQLFKQADAALGKISYKDNIPLLDVFEDVQSAIHKLIGTKSKVWEYENEYRLHKPNFARQTKSLTSEAYSEVIFGCKMDYKTELELIDLIKEEFPNTNVFKTKLRTDVFELEVMHIM